MTDLRLHGLDISVYTRIARLTAAEKGLAVELVALDPFGDGAADAADWPALQPFRRIPVLDHGRFRLYETAAIARYLDALAPEPALVPAAPRPAARMAQAIGILDAYGYRAMVWELFVEEGRDTGPAGDGPDPAVVARGRDTAARVLAALDRLRDGEPFLAGGAPSLADLHAWPMVAYLAEAPSGRAVLAEAPAGWARWIGRMAGRASVAATRSPLETGRVDAFATAA